MKSNPTVPPLQSVASLWRHGATDYKQGNSDQSIVTADDLREEAVAEIMANAKMLASHLLELGVNLVQIHSSPVGRTLHTARLIHEVLLERGLNVVDIVPDHLLGEVKNFTWDLFVPLMQGGTITFGGATFTADVTQTNPLGLPYPDYFMADAIHDLDTAVKVGWPLEYIEHLATFERFEAVTQRVIARMHEIIMGHRRCQEHRHHDVFVTHDGSCMFLLDDATKGRVKSLTPGTCILLGTFFDQLSVLKIGDVEVIQEEEPVGK